VDVLAERNVGPYIHGLYTLHVPASEAEADEVQERIHRARLHGQPVRMTDGTVVGEVAEVAQWPWEPTIAKSAMGAGDTAIVPRTTVIGVVWNSVRIRELAHDAELVLARDGIFLIGS
jgi:hypothetical protein